MSKKRTEFGETLKEKWKAICDAVSKEEDVFLDEYYLSSGFDRVYFFLRSVPKVSPFVALNSVNKCVYSILVAKYPDLREELLNDTWVLIDRNNISRHKVSKRLFPELKYIPYYIRCDVKFSTRIFDKTYAGVKMEDALISALSEMVDSYNSHHREPIDIIWKRIRSAGMEIVVASPLNKSASKIAELVKSNTSRILRQKYPLLNKIVSRKAFWAPSNFYAISSAPIEDIPRSEKSQYIRLRRKWKEAIIEIDTHKKGKLLELFMDELVGLVEGFEILKVSDQKPNINIGFEEIDLVIKNNSKSNVLQYCGPLLKVECKNWSKKIGNSEIRDFSGKLRGNMKTGIMVSVSGFGKFEKDLLNRLFWQDNKLIITISGNEISNWLDKIIDGFKEDFRERKDISDFIEDKISLTMIERT